MDNYNSNNYYSVRPMTNSAMSLSTNALGGDKPVSLGYIGPNETLNHSHLERMWIIEPNGTNYTLKNGDSSQGGYLTCMSAPAGTQVRTALSVTDNGKWNLVPYTGPSIQGAFLTDPSPEVVVGAAFNLDAVVYSSVIGENGPATFGVVGLNNSPATNVMLDPNTGSGSTAQPGVVFIVLNFTESSHSYKYHMSIKTNTCKTVVLDMKYDHVYLVRYPDAPDRIRSHFYALRDLYIKEFDVWVVMTGPTVFSCYACTNCSSTSLERCTHVADTECFDSNRSTGTEQLYEQHHTNLYNIAYRVPRPNKTINLSMYFIGHKCCKEGMLHNTIHLTPPNGLGSQEFGTMIINEHRSIERERMTVVHEFGHMYGVEDHYGGKYDSTDEMNENIDPDLYSQYCIYGEKKINSDIINNITICDGCRQTVESNWDRYSHR